MIKPNRQRYRAAFLVKSGPLDLEDTLKRLRQVRHGLEEHPEILSEPMQAARSNIDAAITALKKQQYITGENATQASSLLPERGTLAKRT